MFSSWLYSTAGNCRIFNLLTPIHFSCTPWIFFLLHHALLHRKRSLTRLFAAPTLPGTTEIMIIFVCWGFFFPREKAASAINRKVTLSNSVESNVGYALKYLPAPQQRHALQRKITRFRQKAIPVEKLLPFHKQILSPLPFPPLRRLSAAPR